jgi:hypothetical protein
MLPTNIGHCWEFLRNVLKDIWKYWVDCEFLCCQIILGILYMFEKNSFLLNNLGIYKILMLKKVWEFFFPRCLKKFRQFWNLRLTWKIIKIDFFFHFCPKILGTLEKPWFWKELSVLGISVLPNIFSHLIEVEKKSFLP